MMWFKSKNVLVLSTLVMMCFAILGFRIIRFETYAFTFLIWNLFLAGIPFVISELLFSIQIKNRFLFCFISSSWLLFLPNAPYILTDIIHLSAFGSAPEWYDMIMILTFALTGLLFGLLSIITMYKLLIERIGKLIGTVIIICTCFLCGFGVYFGRYLRWNSWDILHDPSGLFFDIQHRLVHPLDHPRTYFTTLSIGALMLILVFLFSNLTFDVKQADKEV